MASRPCQYRDLSDEEWRCPFPSLEGSRTGYCILHDEDPDKDRHLFDKAVRLRFENKVYDFKGCVFPEVLRWSDRDFGPGALFSGARFAGPVLFENCRFGRQADFSDCHFHHSAEFIDCKMGDGVFRHVVFEKEARFADCDFSGAVFSSSVFGGEASFWGSTFKARFIGDSVTFQAKVSFAETHFSKSADFAKSEFRGDAEFWDAHFGGDAEMFGTKFLGRLLMHGAVFDMCLLLDGISVANRDDLWYVRVRAKAAFREHGLPELEAREFLRERQMVRESYKWADPRKWGHILVYRLCGYGERPSWLVGWWVGLILSFSILFAILGESAILGASVYERLRSSLYLSIISFTTLGIGSWAIPSDSPLWGLICVEAILGVFMMSLFVMTFGRKMMR